jgi:hypothetical protein
MKGQDLSGYVDDYFTNRNKIEHKSYYLGILRPGDMGAAMCYAFGSAKSYRGVREVLGFPSSYSRPSFSDEHREVLPKIRVNGVSRLDCETCIWYPTDVSLDQQLDKITSCSTRVPDLVVSVGCGKGEIDACFRKLGVRCVGIDPSPALIPIYKDTMEQWADVDDYELYTMGLEEAVERLNKEGLVPDTVIFCESIEHIPMDQFRVSWSYLKDCLIKTSGMLVITNWIYWHPIKASSTWNHVTTIDDTFFDHLCENSKEVIVRYGSHLVIKF